jgi:hypothetical protein
MNIAKQKVGPGRPVTIGATEFVGLRLPAALLQRIEEWAHGEKIIGRSQAVRALIEKAILVLLPRRQRRHDTELSKAIEYAQKLINAAIDVVGGTHIQPNEQRARDPRVVALTLLCRSISNFRAAMLLAQQEQAMESRAMVRLLNENLLWLGALRERGAAFVQNMISDQRHNDVVIARATMRLTSKHGGDVQSEGGLKLRSIIRSLDKQTSKAKKLHADEIASQGVVELAYVDYLTFSLDALHCSVRALGRHLSSKRTESIDELTVSVVPQTPPGEVLSTVLHACRALMGAAIAANELIGFTTASSALAALHDEFEANGWARQS